MVNANLLSGLTFHIFPTHESREEQVLDLVDLIELHGGTVKDLHELSIKDIDLAAADKDDEVYALIDPSETWAPEYFERRMRQDAIDGSTIYFVNWGFPQLCVEENEVLGAEAARDLLIFTQKPTVNGGWIFYFSPKLLLDKKRVKRYSAEILAHGGRVAKKGEEANILIANFDELEDERERFASNHKTRVESRGWLLDSIERTKYLRFTAPVRKPMPGRIPVRQGGKRTDYTQEDKDHLVRYLALRSNVNGQGRLGNNIYIELVDRFETDPAWRKRWPWADRHSWQSWRSQYKMNITAYDNKIEAFIKRTHMPFLDGYGRDPRDRRNNKRSILANKRRSPESGEGSEQVESPNEEEEPEPMRRRRKRPRIVENANYEEELQQEADLGGDGEDVPTGEEEDELAGDRSDQEVGEDDELLAGDNDIGTQEFEAFDEQNPRLLTSTPPPATFDSSRSTLVGATSGRQKQRGSTPPLHRIPSPALPSVVSQPGGMYGVFPEDEEAEPDESGSENAERLSAAPESDAEKNSVISVDDGSEEEGSPEPAIPSRDMVEERQKLRQKRSQRARRSSPVQGGRQEQRVDPEVGNDGLPARSFQVSGSERKSNGATDEDTPRVYTTRSQRPAQRALRATGIFPSSQRGKQPIKKK